MTSFEKGLDAYLEQTSLFPHSQANKGNRLLSVEEKENLKRIYKALGMTSRGKLLKSVAQKRAEKLLPSKLDPRPIVCAYPFLKWDANPSKNHEKQRD